MERSSEQLIRHLKEHYRYDPAAGVVRNRKNQIVKGAVNSCGYLKLNIWVDGQLSQCKLHQVVWALVYGCWPTQIDHINGNPHDNRVENLREVTPSENCLNRLRPWKPNPSTGLPGVSKSGDGFKIVVGSKHYNFHDKYEAFHTLTMLGRMFREV